MMRVRFDTRGIELNNKFFLRPQEEQGKTKIRNEKIQKIREGLQKSSQWSQYFKNLEFEEGETQLEAGK